MIYSPKSKIVIASSTEGVVWDGAKECYLVTHNAALKNLSNYKRAEPFDHVIEPKEFTENKEEFLKTKYLDAALKLRPLVKKAWHYFLVFDMINKNPDWTEDILENPENENSYLGFINKFKELKALTPEKMQKKADDLFYDERKRMKRDHHFDWLELYEPIGNRWEEFGKLAETKKSEKGEIVSGFIPAFATAKDEDTSHIVCVHFVKTEKLDKRHYSDEKAYACTVQRDLIVGKDRVPSRRKVDQLGMLGKITGVPKTQVWNLNDMYGREELEGLWGENYRFNFLLPGYIFPFDVEKAKNDPLVTVLEENFAEQLGKKAEDIGF